MVGRDQSASFPQPYSLAKKARAASRSLAWAFCKRICVRYPPALRRYCEKYPDRMLVGKVVGASTTNQTEVYKAHFRLGKACERIGIRISFRTLPPHNGKYFTVILPKTPEEAVALRMTSADRLVPARDVLSTE